MYTCQLWKCVTDSIFQYFVTIRPRYYCTIILLDACSTPLTVVLSSSSSSESISQESLTYKPKQFSCLIHFSSDVSIAIFNACNTDSLIRASYCMIVLE